ncbi:MAG: hypothetical protein IKD77_04655 [Bacilli bacterium]|nr:hypothetical protein [Bacilli bacterium]
MLIVKIIIGIMLLIGLLGILVVIGAGKLRTDEDMINDIEEEAKALKELEEQKILRKKNKKRIFKNILHIH